MPLLGAPGSWMTWRSTNYREFTGDDGPSPDLAFSPDNSRITRTLLVGGERLTWQQAREDFLGFAQVVTASGARYISRLVPHSFPFEDWLFARAIPRIEQGGFSQTTSDVAEYSQMKMQVSYEALTFNILEDAQVLNIDSLSPLFGQPDEGAALATGWENSRWITKLPKPGSKLYSLNRGVMQIVGEDINNIHPPFVVSQPRPLLEGLPFKEALQDVTYVWSGVPIDGVPNILHLVAHGCVNDATFDRYPAGTLRLESIEPQPRRDPLGNRTMDVVYKMQFLPRVGHRKGETSANDAVSGHNWVYTYDPGPPADLIVARVTSDGLPTGTPPYRSMDFRLLFNPDQP